MRRRRPRPAPRAALAVLAVVAAAAGVLTGPAAFGDTPPAAGTLYVNHDVACSDDGTGTQSLPYCSIQPALDAVTAGQTMRIENRNENTPYQGALKITHSGTPDAPITITGMQPPVGTTEPEVDAPDGTPALILDGVHDVHVDTLQMSHASADGIDVTGSQDVTLDGLVTLDRGHGTTPTVPDDSLLVDGSSADVTVSRSGFHSPTGDAVRVASGAQHVTVTTNVVIEPRLDGIDVSGVSGAVVTSNSVEDHCGTGIVLDGGTSATVENNVIGAQYLTSCADPTTPAYTVSADSAAGVTSDYNTLAVATARRPAYSWAGTTYSSAAAFHATTGQGAHDADDPGLVSTITTQPENAEPIDSADAEAPGELATDIDGAPRVDDPLVADSGSGDDTHVDRGAFERQDTFTVPGDDTITPTLGAAPLATSVKVGDTTDSWGEPLAFTVDFGDGSGPVTSSGGSAITHTYTTPGKYTETETVTDSSGSSTSRTYTPVTVATTDPLPASLSVTTESVDGLVDGGAADFHYQSSSEDAWELSDSVSFGDGSSFGDRHEYSAPGIYHPTLTQTDVLGRTTTARTTFMAGDTFIPQDQYDRQQTVPAGGTVTLSDAQVDADSDGVNAVELGLTVSAPAASGYLTAYPGGSARPGTSSLNFYAGRTVTNHATVTLGASHSVTLYNGGTSAVSVEVDTYGVQTDAQYAYLYTPATPARLLYTGKLDGVPGPVGANKSVTFTVGGTHGVPSDAAAVLLNVAANSTQAAGHMDVAPEGAPDEDSAATYWNAGQTVSNLVVVPLVDGKVQLTNYSSGSANFFADLVGWYAPGTTGSEYLPTAPARILNTKTGTGNPGGTAASLAAGATLKLKVAGVDGAPAGLSAADLNLTVSNPSAGGYLTTYADGTARPGTSSLNYTSGVTTPNRAVVNVGSDGEIDIYNGGTQAITLYADLLGGYAPLTTG